MRGGCLCRAKQAQADLNIIRTAYSYIHYRSDRMYDEMYELCDAFVWQLFVPVGHKLAFASEKRIDFQHIIINKYIINTRGRYTTNPCNRV